MLGTHGGLSEKPLSEDSGLRAEIVMQDFPNKTAVFYIFAMMMATAVHVETLELYKVFEINTEHENLTKRAVTGQR